MNTNNDILNQVPQPQPKEDVMAYHLNHIIQFGGVNTNLISDGYHSFEELYEHRITLYIRLLSRVHFDHRNAGYESPVWKSEVHSDGSVWDGWFILGIYSEKGEQITYHLPTSKWDECSFAKVVDKAPEWDGHNSNDVLERLKNL